MYVPEFRPTNQKMAVGFLIIIVVLVAVWCVMSRTGENPGKTDNDISGSVAELENRIDKLESRITSLSNRIDHAEETLTGIGERIDASQNHAGQIANGIDSLQNRIDHAVQGSGRIQNIIAEVERTNR